MNKQRLLLSLCAAGALLLGVVGFFVGKSMGGGSGDASASQKTEVAEETVWTCSMHPQIKLKKPGKCPICAMDLIPLKPGEFLGDRQIKLSPVAEKLANIEVMPVVRKEFYMTVPMVGKISLDETRSKKITSRYAGRLDRLYVDYTGVEVKKGDHLFEIYSPALITAQEELAQAIESAKAMKNSSVKAVRESSEKAVEASRDKLRLWGLTDQQIKKFEETKVVTDHVTTFSPIEGVVVKKHVDEGSYVKEGSVIYSIASLDYLWVELDAYESDLQWLHYAQDVSFTTEAYPGEEFHGRISFINPLLNDKTRTVKVRVNVENRDRRLKPEMFVRAEVRVNINAAGKVIDKALSGKWISPMHPEVISDKPGPCTVCGMDLVPAEEYGFAPKGGKTENPLVVPASAPLITGKRAVVYMKSTSREGVYEGRTITLGLKAGEHYIVKSGLRQGELVVIKGAFKIDSALQIQAKPSMMSLEAEKKKKQIEVSLEFKKSLSAVYDLYDLISKELSKDSIADIKPNVEKLKKAVESLSPEKETPEAKEFWDKRSKEVVLALNVLGTSSSIDQARKYFENLSTPTIELVKTFGTVEDINLAFCPMAFNDKGAYWLQKAAEVENPYFGSQMFHCGDIKEKFTFAVSGYKISDKSRAVLNEVLQNYMTLSNSLAEDKMPQKSDIDSALAKLSSINMKNMPEEVHLAFMNELQIFKEAASKIDDKAKLADYRQFFEIYSKTLTKMFRMFDAAEKDLLVLHCPMAFDGKGADWLQHSEKTKNPYLGLDMQACGDLKDKIQVAAKEEKPETVDPHAGHKMEKEKPVEDKIEKKEVPAEKKAMEKHDHTKMKMTFPASALKAYLNLHKSLSQDRFPETGKDDLLKGLEELAAGEKVLTAAKQIFESKKIAEVREKFEIVSNFFIAKSSKVSFTQDVNLAHCPMAFDGKGADWLQIGDKVENPYFGSQMYRCGKVKKKIEGNR